MFGKVKKGFALALTLAMVLTTAVGCDVKVNKPNDSTSSSTVSAIGSDGDQNSDGVINSEGGQVSDSSDGSVPDNQDGSSVAGGSQSNTSSKGQNVTSNSSYKEPIFNLNGREIKIAWEGAVPDRSKKTIFNESLTLTEKKFNCKFKFVQKSDYFNLFYSIINDHAAGTASYDVVALRGYDVYPNMATSGAVLKLDQYYDFNNDPTWQTGIFKSLGVFKGNRYGIPYTPNEVGDGIWYNRALLRKFNVPDLWEYVKNDTWNWNTFRAVCKKLTKDTNGDGKPDYWAFTASDPFLSFIYSNNGSLLTSGVNGVPRIALDSKNAIEAIQFITDLHIIDNTIPDGKELGEITDKPFNALFTGKVAMSPYHARYGAVMEAQDIASADIGWVYFPKGPSAKSYITPSGTMPDMFVVPSAVKKPKEVVAAIQDFSAYWDTSREIKRDVLDKTEELYGFLKTSIDANAKKVLMHQAVNPVFTLANNYNLSETLQQELWPMILKQEKSVKSAVDTLKGKMQEELTSKYNGTIVKK